MFLVFLIDFKIKKMAKCVCNGAKIACSFGTGPKTMMVLPLNRVLTANTKPIANNLDIIPFLNIPPFGSCMSIANPMVIAATAAAFGVLTPQPCIPIPVSPWSPAAIKTKIGGNPVVLANSKTMCAWAGSISVVNPGQTKIDCS